MSFLRTITRNLYFPLLFCSLIFLSAQSPPAREYQIKAVFLLNFTQFIEWPENAFPTAESPMVIGILGEDPFRSYLDEVIASENAKGHPLVIERFKSIDQIKKCHILFISKSQTGKMDRIKAGLKGMNTLTVSDATNFMREGGMIRFITVNKKIQIQINPETAKAAELNVSSKLLRLAEIVSTQ